MNPYCYYNTAGQRFPFPERPLEPPEDQPRAARPWASKSHARVNLYEEAPASSAKADEGEAEQTLTGPVSASNDT